MNIARGVAAAALVCLSVFWAAPALALAGCTDAQEASAHTALVAFSRPSNRPAQAAAIARHLPWGVPASPAARRNEIPLIQEGYVSRYDTRLLVPIWSAEEVISGNLTGGRIDCMREDPRLPPHQQSTRRDYIEPTYDQGHLTPSADQVTSENAVISSFVMSNMTPQTCPFNQGIWQILEGVTRQWAGASTTIYLINGVVFDWNGDGRRDADSTIPRMRPHRRVAVPSHFYKIVTIRRSNGSLETLSILMPNDFTMLSGQAATQYLQGHITTLANIERQTGLRFFTGTHARPVEATTLWPLTASVPHNLCSRPARPAGFP